MENQLKPQIYSQIHYAAIRSFDKKCHEKPILANKSFYLCPRCFTKLVVKHEGSCLSDESKTLSCTNDGCGYCWCKLLDTDFVD